MSAPTRQQGLLARLKPFEYLHRAHQTEILAWKKEFSEHGEELRACLNELGVPQLEPYLAWIPPKVFSGPSRFKKLAEGGFAKVYQSEVYVNSRLYSVAAKELKPSMVEELVLNIYLSRCGNINNNAPTMDIVAVSQFLETKKYPAVTQHPETKMYLMIMPFADIGTLENHPCEQDGDWYTAFTYAIKLASRLASLHNMGYSHKDLHPGNVVFHKAHTALLIDVGLSQAVEDANSEKGVYGRMAYFPPEIFKADEYTQKSDIYCLGTLLWQLIVGVPPQVNASAAVASNPDGLREELISGAPTTFNDIIRSCWHINPNQRPSALEVHNQLLECAAGLVGIPFVLQPNIEDHILGALAITPMPFSLEMQSFIKARRAIHQQELESTNNSSDFEFVDGSRTHNIGSKFYSHSNLKQITEEHSRSTLVTPVQQSNRGYDSIEEKNVRTNQITTKNLTDNKVDSILVKVLKQKTVLHELNLSGKYTSDRERGTLIEFLKQNTNVTKLDLSANEIGILLTRALAESLKQNTTLTELNLESNIIGYEGGRALAESLKQNTTLTELNLKSNSIGHEGARALAESLKQNMTLTELNLGGNSIGYEGAHALAESLKQNTTLTELNLSSNSIGHEGAHALAESLQQNTILTKLNLGDDSIGDDGARALAESLKQNTTLTELLLYNNGIGDEGARALAESLRQNMTLAELNLFCNSFGHEGARAIAEPLKQNTALAKLNLGGHSIGNEGARALAQSLKQNATLTELILSNNSIDSDPPKSLKQSTTLTELNLRGTIIGDEGARALAEPLNTTLSKLELESNSIGHEGARALAESLMQNTALTKLNLRGHRIGNEGARALAQSLKQNTTLTELILSNNRIGEEGARALAESLKQNTTLTELNLRDNNISSEVIGPLSKSLKWCKILV